MQKINSRIYEIVEKGMLGKGLERDEILTLYSVKETSPEAALIRWAGQELSKQASNGKAEIHAQIGLDSTVCGRNCKFCSFARINEVRSGRYELPVEDVVEYAKIYEEQKANLILMLTTASYKFEKLLEMVHAVREVISTEMPLLVNTDDMTLEHAQKLKEAGANGAYHAVRMREGDDTGIPIEKRLETFKHMKEAGLKLSTCVEPIGPEHTPEELTKATLTCMSTGALTSGAGKRIAVPGTQVFERGMITEVAAANYIAVYRLAAGSNLRLTCSATTPLTASAGGNLAWAEVGTNPRDLVERTEDGGRGNAIEHCRKQFLSAGWEILEGPSQGWM